MCPQEERPLLVRAIVLAKANYKRALQRFLLFFCQPVVSGCETQLVHLIVIGAMNHAAIFHLTPWHTTLVRSSHNSQTQLFSGYLYSCTFGK